MAKKVKAVVKLQIPAGKANPAPPVGPALAQHGINVNCIAPAIIGTNRPMKRLWQTPGLLETMQKNIPIGRIGTPEECIERINVYRDLGVSEFVLQFPSLAVGDMRELELFAESVIPVFK